MAVPHVEPLAPHAVDVWDVALRVPRDVPLTRLLARYVGCAPEEVEIARREHGKPYLRAPDGPRFSVTHSGLRAFVAVALDREVGVDLEEIGPRPRAEDMARRWFSERERRHVDVHPPAERLAAFHRVWTVKEACVKASGVGLSGLDATDVALVAAPRLASWSTTADGRWSVRMLDAGPEWAAAVAVEGASRRPRVRLRRL